MEVTTEPKLRKHIKKIKQGNDVVKLFKQKKNQRPIIITQHSAKKPVGRTRSASIGHIPTTDFHELPHRSTTEHHAAIEKHLASPLPKLQKPKGKARKKLFGVESKGDNDNTADENEAELPTESTLKEDVLAPVVLDAEAAAVESGLSDASSAFDVFMSARDLQAILRSFALMKRFTLAASPSPPDGKTWSNKDIFQMIAKQCGTNYQRKQWWKLLTDRMTHADYKDAPCRGMHVLVVGAGPAGLRTAIELLCLGAQVTIVEKRNNFSRYNILRLWETSMEDLKGLGARFFDPVFGTTPVHHMSIRTLQNVLVRGALALGATLKTKHEFIGFEPVPEASTASKQHPIVQCRVKNVLSGEQMVFNPDVVIASSGEDNIVSRLAGFEQTCFQGAEAIGVTANFVNHHSKEENVLPELSSSQVYFREFFARLESKYNIITENLVYYRGHYTHYFVLTPKKECLFAKGVLNTLTPASPAEMFAPSNVNRPALMQLARELADEVNIPSTCEFALDHKGRPDVQIFDFSRKNQLNQSCRMLGLKELAAVAAAKAEAEAAKAAAKVAHEAAKVAAQEAATDVTKEAKDAKEALVPEVASTLAALAPVSPGPVPVPSVSEGSATQSPMLLVFTPPTESQSPPTNASTASASPAASDGTGAGANPAVTISVAPPVVEAAAAVPSDTVSPAPAPAATATAGAVTSAVSAAPVPALTPATTTATTTVSGSPAESLVHRTHHIGVHANTLPAHLSLPSGGSAVSEPQSAPAGGSSVSAMIRRFSVSGTPSSPPMGGNRSPRGSFSAASTGTPTSLLPTAVVSPRRNSLQPTMLRPSSPQPLATPSSPPHRGSFSGPSSSSSAGSSSVGSPLVAPPSSPRGSFSGAPSMPASPRGSFSSPSGSGNGGPAMSVSTSSALSSHPYFSHVLKPGASPRTSFSVSPLASPASNMYGSAAPSPRLSIGSSVVPSPHPMHPHFPPITEFDPPTPIHSHERESTSSSGHVSVISSTPSSISHTASDHSLSLPGGVGSRRGSLSSPFVTPLPSPLPSAATTPLATPSRPGRRPSLSGSPITGIPSSVLESKEEYAEGNADGVGGGAAGHKLLVCAVGDALTEPFWPLGTGGNRALLSALDTSWVLRAYGAMVVNGPAHGFDNFRPILQYRESMYAAMRAAMPSTANTLCEAPSGTSYLDPASRYSSTLLRPYRAPAKKPISADKDDESGDSDERRYSF